MKTLKKVFAAFTAAFVTAVLAVPGLSAFAAEKSLTPANAAPYTVLMGIKADCVNTQGNELWDQSGTNFQTITTDGDYKVSYVIERDQGSAKNINTLVLDTNMSKTSLPNVVITVNSVSLVKGNDGTIVSMPCDSTKAVQTTNANDCHRLNILYSYGTTPAKAIDPEMPDFAKTDELTVTFNISGLAPAQPGGNTDTTTVSSNTDPFSTSTTTTTAAVAYTSNAGASVNGTGTVAQTADFGVAVIVVSGAAAAALAIGAVTLRKKKK